MAIFQSLFIGAAMFSSAMADFHIIINDNSIAAIPSNKYDCRALTDGFDTFKNAALLLSGLPTGDVPTTNFQMRGSLCGASALNFYPQSDGTIQAFINNGDGSLLATCHNDARKNTIHCSDGQNWSEKFVCYSNLCK